MNLRNVALAANGYSDLYSLLDEGRAPVDFIKCPLSPDGRAEVAQARRYRPAVLHCWGPPGYSATRRTIPEPELLAELSETSGTPFVSVHFDYHPTKDGEMTRTELISHVTRIVAELKEISGKEILLENVPWYAWKDRPREATDPDLISEAVRSSGARFLIDVAHARVAAWHRGEDPKEYLAALPLDQAWEAHVSGPRLAPEGLRDRHMSLAPEDFELLAFAMERAPDVSLITCEYAGRREGRTTIHGEPDGPDRLAEDLARLDEFRASLR